jgi:hypothetical protein
MFTCPPRAAPALAATESPTVPLASADCPLTTEIHAALLVAVQRHPESVVTATLSRPPASPIVSLVRDKEKTHGAACWLTATLFAPTAIAADRGEGTGFAATLYAMLASPWPLAAPTASHDALLATDHVQSRSVVIVKDPLPPGEGRTFGLLVTVTSQRSGVAEGALIDVSVLVQAADANVVHTAARAAATVFLS